MHAAGELRLQYGDSGTPRFPESPVDPVTLGTDFEWRAAGGKDLQDQFFPGPNSVREIGCAAEAEIVEAKFADF